MVGYAPKITRQMVEDARKAVLEHGNVSAAAKALSMDRGTFQTRLRAADRFGMGKLMKQANPARWRPGDEIVAARKAEFERVKGAGPKAQGNVIHLPDDGPFMLVPLGDPHLDSPGTDLALWERWISVLDRKKHRTAILMGDLLDNWVKPLAHLYSTAETPAPEGWILLQHYLDQIGPDTDICVQGNHDLWSGHSDVAGMLLERHGILQRPHSIRVHYRTRSGRDITVHARHSWSGRSQWSEVHALKKAARLGVRDTILLGGHTHVSGEGMEKDPMTGKMSFVYQLAAFKVEDEYADALGFLDRHTSPALALVIDPRRPDNDPELVKHFFDPQNACDYLAFLRRKLA